MLRGTWYGRERVNRIADCTVRKKIMASNAAKRMLCELEVTVCTGFEMTAKEEIEEKISCASNLTAARGRVNMLVPINDAKNVRPVAIFSQL